MNNRMTILAAVAALFLACSWSERQERILSSFNRIRTMAEEDQWNSLITELTPRTRVFLDSLSTSFAFRGLHGYDSSSDLLKTLCLEYVDFGGEVTVIFVQKEEAELTVTAARPGSFYMDLQGGEWKLDLESVFQESLDEELRGSYVR